MIKRENNKIYYLLLALLYFEYIKPTYFHPAIGMLRLPIISATILMLYSIYKIINGKIIIETKLTTIQILLILSMIISTAFAHVQYTSLIQFIDNFKLFLLYVFIVILCSDIEKITKAIYVWIASFLTACVIGLSLFINGKYIDDLAVGGSLGGGDDLAAAFSIIIPICYFMHHYVNKYKIIFIILSLIFSVTVILIGSRGGFLGLGACVLSILLMSPNKKLAYSLLLIGILSILLLAPPKFFSEVKSITDTKESTAHERLSLWSDGVEIFIKNPIIGIGVMNFPSYHGKYYINTNLTNAKTSRWRVAHSDPITILCELGIIGFILYVMTIYYIVKYNIAILKINMSKKDNRIKLISKGILSGFIGYFICSIFLTLIYYPHIYIIAALTNNVYRIALTRRI